MCNFQTTTTTIIDTELKKRTINQARTTEMSSSTPPIPLIPPSTFSPSNSAPPPSPQNNITLENPSVNRQILEPVPPSKRAAPYAADSVLTGQTIEAEETHPYLPKELAEIFTARQRQEQAWHTRFLICTNFISCIDSTVSSFQEGAEKEMAKILHAYLRSAISEFAAADSSPSVPKFLPKNNALTSNGVHKANLPAKPTIVATPPELSERKLAQKITQLENTLPKPSKTTEIPWSTVVRNGHKKARATLTSVTQTTQPKQKIAQVVLKTALNPKTATKESATSIQDKRLFIRLSNDHEWRKLSPAGIREVVVKRLSISPTSIGTIKPVRSGYALSPRNDETRQELLKSALRLSSCDAKLEAASNWTPVMIPTVPASIYTLAGRVEVTKEILADEIERVSSERPASLRLYGRNLPNAPHRTWIAYFNRAPRPGFRVFDESGIVRKLKKSQPLDFCKRCNGHHSSKNCSRAPSCGNCGSTMHSEDICKAITKCKNCGGPHRSDSRRCLARPTRTGTPTKEQLKIFRRAGDREYQAMVRAKAAEEKAAAVEESTSQKNSQPDVMNIDNTQASTIEIATGGAPRL